ncbi:hypothetical protein CRI77_21690 [Mycolicibacterium duvalii]|nr:hypothetical protein [Mycolicibacterium duvalii]MCV7369848.1 hypothetical protein [Mycolicibacterium duvalii]PEG37020.1 hypothetical protein CRI77_21690 [Mycolicibacterium duvalii]
MSNWISRLAHRLADLYHLPPVDGGTGDCDPETRRMRSELDAIRMRFPDHA